MTNLLNTLLNASMLSTKDINNIPLNLNLASIEREASLDTFKPNWQKEKRADQRAHVIERWKQATSIFSPFQTMESDGRERVKQAKILPLWHGSSADKCDSISTSGFVYFGKTSLSGKQANDPKSTDEGTLAVESILLKVLAMPQISMVKDIS